MARWMVIGKDDECRSIDCAGHENENAHLLSDDIDADTAQEAIEKVEKQLNSWGMLYEDLVAYRLDDDQVGIVSTQERLEIVLDLLDDAQVDRYGRLCGDAEDNKKKGGE